VGICLMICSNAEARQSAQRVLQYLESLKNVETEREGN
jgi:RAB protein geranylgeranyltransferase component A